MKEVIKPGYGRQSLRLCSTRWSGGRHEIVDPDGVLPTLLQKRMDALIFDSPSRNLQCMPYPRMSLSQVIVYSWPCRASMAEWIEHLPNSHEVGV
ncbi:hypothetical protein EVAR_73977_1 [Eumeta japonica]|uniref:Uncharacterized protein n=1 Tax=Eumeta variegata TaxID=151549 RepID=A0A4C1TK96_EUMVA|nr:hypothetical protein EVAR_73977_1 [Eumeta japonica]